MIYIKQLTTDERATWGMCPVCNVRHGEACTLSMDDFEEYPIDDLGLGAHVARLINAPQTAAINDGD